MESGTSSVHASKEKERPEPKDLENEVTKADRAKQNEPEEEARHPEAEETGGGAMEMKKNVTSKRTDTTSQEDLQRRLQQLIEEINAKRKRDTDILNDFRKVVEMQVNNSSSVLEAAIVQTYEKRSKTIQDKLNELFAVLERIGTLESELLDFKQVLALLYNDVQTV